MDAMLLIDAMLVSTSAIMAVTLWLAWRLFDRERHALTWALSFLCGVGQWTVSGVGGRAMPALWLAGTLVTVMTTLIAIGARQRAGRPRHYGRLTIAWVGASLVLAVCCFGGAADGVRLFWTNLAPAAMLLVALEATWPRGRRPNLSEAYLATVLLAFALLCLLLAGAALAENGTGKAYRLLLAFGLPPLGIALGVAFCFVLAGDLGVRLHALVTRDPLTGALNRRGLEQAAALAIAAARRHRRPLTLVAADLDRFKAINDTHGHAAGDQALCRFADAAQATIRDEDLLARLGGDEFCLLLVEANEEASLRVVERLRKSVGDGVTASFGLATLSPNETLDQLIARADAALYRAKAEGRDRAILASAA